MVRQLDITSYAFKLIFRLLKICINILVTGNQRVDFPSNENPSHIPPFNEFNESATDSGDSPMG